MRTLQLHNSISFKQIMFLWLALCLLPGVSQATGKYLGSHYGKHDSKRYSKNYSDRHHKNGHQYNRCEKHCDNALTIPLLVDQKTQVGVVKVTYDEHRLNIKYVANDGWRIEKTHLAVSDSFEGIPQDGYGNPRLKHFPYKTAHRKPVQTVNQMLSASRWPIGTELYIAAQANVIAKNPMHHGKSRYEAKTWSGKWSKQGKSDVDGDNHGHDSDNESDNESNEDKYSLDKSSKSKNLKHWMKRFFSAKEPDTGHRHNAACQWGKKHEKSHNNSISSWARGYDFPGSKAGFYFTYLLKPCNPVNTSTIQFSQAVYTSVENETEAKITVTRSGDLSKSATVRFVTSDGTAIAGLDYVAVDEVVTFQPDITQLDVSIFLIDDSEVEDVKTVNLQLLDAEGAALGDQDTAILEIDDDDEIMPQLDSFVFEPPQYEVRERDSLAILTVKRIGNLAGEATVDFAATGGSAINGVDYELMPGTLIFMDGENTMTITVIINEDRAVESDETIIISLANPINGELGAPAEAVLVIKDNDGPNSN
ncbi:Calx-beta domain-containing protein [Kaarinaea lacus]